MLKNPFFIIGIVFSFILFIYYVFQDYFKNVEGYNTKPPKTCPVCSTSPPCEVCPVCEVCNVSPPQVSPANQTRPPDPRRRNVAPANAPNPSVAPCDPNNPSFFPLDPPSYKSDYNLFIDFTSADSKNQLFSNLNDDILFVKYLSKNITQIQKDNMKNIVMDSNGAITSLRGKDGKNRNLGCILLRCFLINVDLNNYYIVSSTSSPPPGSSQMQCFMSYINNVSQKFDSIQIVLGTRNYTLSSLSMLLYNYFMENIVLKRNLIKGRNSGGAFEFNQDALNNYMSDIGFVDYMNSLNYN